MSKTIFIDTLFVVALVNERDQYHERANKLSDELEGRRFLITDPVLLEIGNALARSFKDRAIEVIHDCLTSDDVELIRLTPAIFDEGFALYQSHGDKEWGLVDCISFVVMRAAGIEECIDVRPAFRAGRLQGPDARLIRHVIRHRVKGSL